VINARRLTTANAGRRFYPKIVYRQISRKFRLPLFLTLLHIPLGLVLYRTGNLALLHPLIVFFVGLRVACLKSEKIEKTAYAVAYLIGAEVLWRMAALPLPWEFGKYAAALIMVAALVRRDLWKIPTSPLLYILLLVPACLLTIENRGFGEARGLISSNMSGPLLLFVAGWFFSHLRVTPATLKKLLFFIILPVVSVAVTTLFYTVTVEDIVFTNESNFATSGGFGPNQVSTVLGLGIFVCLACYVLFKNDLPTVFYLVVFTVFFAIQSVLTFSRSGIYNALGAILFVIFFRVRKSGRGFGKLIPLAGVAILFLMMIFPYLNDFTGGKLQERFGDTGTTNRAEIVGSDIQLFLENPVFGTGVGEAKYAREEYLDMTAASHTEFTRLIAEHGLFGLLALIVLGIGIIHNFRRQKTAVGKALVAGVIVWSGFYMLNSGMRLAAASFIWGLSYLMIAGPPRSIERKFHRGYTNEKRSRR
jgi:hypothetical protein